MSRHGEWCRWVCVGRYEGVMPGARPPARLAVSVWLIAICRYATVRYVVFQWTVGTSQPTDRRSVTRRPATVILYIFTRTHRIRFTLYPANSRFLVVTSHCLYFVYFSTYLGLVLGSLWTLSEPCWSCTLPFVTVILLAFTNKWLIDWLIDRLWRFCLSLTLSVLDF